MKKIFLGLLLITLAFPIFVFAKSDNANAANSNGSANANSNARGLNSPSPTTSVTSSSASNGNGHGNVSQGLKNWQDKYSEYKNAGQAQKNETLKSLGATLVQNRITLLTNLKTMIQNMTNLSDTVKQQIIAEIDKAIQDLTTAQGNIRNQSDIQQLKNEINAMLRQQVYAAEAPSDLGQAIVAEGMYIMGRLQAIQRQLQQTIDQNKNAGKDVSQIQPLITKVNEQLDIAKAQLAIADTKFKNLTPANTDTARTTRDEGKAAMRKAKDALKLAHQYLVQIRQMLAGVSPTAITPSASVSPVISASPSISPTVSPSTSPTLSPQITPSPVASSNE